MGAGAPLRQPVAGTGSGRPHHIPNVDAYHARFTGQLDDFHGVATNYLGWRRALDVRKDLNANLILNLTLENLQHSSRT